MIATFRYGQSIVTNRLVFNYFYYKSVLTAVFPAVTLNINVFFYFLLFLFSHISCVWSSFVYYLSPVLIVVILYKTWVLSIFHFHNSYELSKNQISSLFFELGKLLKKILNFEYKIYTRRLTYIYHILC